jgi:hypothetical protein
MSVSKGPKARRASELVMAVRRSRYAWLPVAGCALLLALFAVKVTDGSDRYWITELLLGQEAGEAARSKAKAEWQKKQEGRIASLVASNWRIVADTTAVVVYFERGEYRSSLAKIGDVSTPSSLNLIATDYRCVYCRADEPLVMEMIRSRQGEKFVFVETAKLGAKSRDLAMISLGAAKLGDYAKARRMLFELSSGSINGVIDRLAPLLETDAAILAAASRDAESMVEEHLKLSILLGIKVTPTYVLNGRPRVGVLIRTGD